jgi:hypothetical protein
MDRPSRQERANVPDCSYLRREQKTANVCLLIKKQMSILPPWLTDDTENVQPQEDLHEEPDLHTQDVEPICLKQDLEGIRDTLLELVDLVEDLLDTLTPLTMDCTK